MTETKVITVAQLRALVQCLNLAYRALVHVDRFQTAKDASAVRHAMYEIERVLNQMVKDNEVVP
jgi:hypothetical protein